jgi:hypothetical protein
MRKIRNVPKVPSLVMAPVRPIPSIDDADVFLKKPVPKRRVK